MELDEPVADPASQVEVVIRPPSAAVRLPKATEFWVERSVEQLAKEQGVVLPQPVDDLFGQGADLWATEEEFLDFVQGIQERRRSQTPIGGAP